MYEPKYARAFGYLAAAVELYLRGLVTEEDLARSLGEAEWVGAGDRPWTTQADQPNQ